MLTGREWKKISFSSLVWVEKQSYLTQKTNWRFCQNLGTRITREKDEKAGEQRRNKAELAAENDYLCPRFIPESTHVVGGSVLVTAKVSRFIIYISKRS